MPWHQKLLDRNYMRFHLRTVEARDQARQRHGFSASSHT